MVSALAGFAPWVLCMTIEIHKIQGKEVCTEMWQCSKLQFSKRAYSCTVNWLLSQTYSTTSMWNPSRSASFRSKRTKVETTLFDSSHRWNMFSVDTKQPNYCINPGLLYPRQFDAKVLPRPPGPAVQKTRNLSKPKKNISVPWLGNDAMPVRELRFFCRPHITMELQVHLAEFHEFSVYKSGGLDTAAAK